MGRVRLRVVRHRLLLAGDRGLARRNREDDTAGDDRVANGPVATRPRRPPCRGRLVHPSDAGSQFTSVSFAETLALEGIAASIGSIGDAYDNALAESTIGLFKNEAIRDGSPFRTGALRTIDDVEWITTDWVDWHNARRLHSTIGDIPPDELEAAYYADLETPSRPVMAPA